MAGDNRENGQWVTLAATSSGELTRNTPSECDPRVATRLAAKLFGCYRASEANDPDVYVTAAAALLAGYPDAVAAKVCDPIRGLPSTNKFLPAIAEIREACEREMVWHYAVERRERVREETLTGRRDSHKAPVGSPEHQRVVAGLKALREKLEPVRDAALTPEARLKRLDEIADDYARTPPAVNTKEMRQYLDRMEEDRPPDEHSF
jgi:hypothetical protein